jgi:hypothetical protein
MFSGPGHFGKLWLIEPLFSTAPPMTTLYGGSALAGNATGAVNTAANPAVLVPASPGNIIRVWRIILTLGSGGSFPNVLTFQDSVPTTLSGPMEFANTGGSIFAETALDDTSLAEGKALFTCTLGAAFQVVNSGLIQISGTIYWTATPT